MNVVIQKQKECKRDSHGKQRKNRMSCGSSSTILKKKTISEKRRV
jgi:hypothetical protein